MLDLLIIQHEKDTPPGTTLQWVADRNLKAHIWKINETAKTPYPASKVKAVLICGGTMDTWEEEKFPWLKIEKQFIQECLKLKKPLFGLCLGSQLLAEALGGKVYSMKKWEIGFLPVRLLESNNDLNVFHWHQYTFDLPPGATLLATHEFCPNQAFRYGDNVVATQFHPEASVEWVQECAASRDEGSYDGRVQNGSQMLQALPFQKIQQDWFFHQLDQWYARKV